MRESLVPFEEAWSRVMRAAVRPKREKVPLAEAEGRILASSVRADRDIPPFDRAALDGYAVFMKRPFKAPIDLPVVGEIVAGEKGPARVRPDECVRILTGAAVPKDALGIVPVEQASEEAGRATLTATLDSEAGRRQGIADRGEDARRGQSLLARGRRIGLPELAVLATVGADPVPVYAVPSLATITTGHELVPPAVRPGPVQIRSTNDLLVERVARTVGGGRIRRIGIIDDDPASLRRAIRKGLEHDVLVVTGGISKGRLDLVPELLQELGVKIRLHRVAIRPGKPFLFGVRVEGRRRTSVFGLPGNPVSTLVTASVFLAPYLRACSGSTTPDAQYVMARIEEPIRRGGGLRHFVPCDLRTDGEGTIWARELRLHGSGDLVTTVHARGFIRVPGDEEQHAAGSCLRVDLLPGCLPRGELT